MSFLGREFPWFSGFSGTWTATVSRNVRFARGGMKTGINCKHPWSKPQQQQERIRSSFSCSHSCSSLLSKPTVDVACLKDWLKDDKATQSYVWIAGRNSSGKSLALDQLLLEERQDDDDGDLRVEVISFDSTLEFLKQHGRKSVATVCGGVNTAQARALIVRFGLIPCWTKNVDSLSSGELRKLTLARAMASEPKTLLLDGAHDGLDPKSRDQLGKFLGNLSKGLPPLLVQLGGTGQSKQKVQANIAQVAHRTSELPEILSGIYQVDNLRVEDVSRRTELNSEARDNILENLPNGKMNFEIGDEEREGLLKLLFDEKETERKIKTETKCNQKNETKNVIAKFQNASIQFGSNEEANVNQSQFMGGLNSVSFEILPGQVWHFVGANGSGKTTISRCLSTPGTLDQDKTIGQEIAETENQAKFVNNNEKESISLFGYPRGSDACNQAILQFVGTVSINGHMRTLFKCGSDTVEEILLGAFHGRAASGSFASSSSFSSLFSSPEYECEYGSTINDDNNMDKKSVAALRLVGLNPTFLNRRFESLSTGEQRMVCVARSLMHGPKLVILDEAAQGLDGETRKHLTDLFSFLSSCANKFDIAIVQITHHDDEVLENATNLLVLNQGNGNEISTLEPKQTISQLTKELIQKGY